MGPLTLADFIGLDVCVDIMRVLVEGLGEPEVQPRVRCWCAWFQRDGWGASPARVFYSY